MLARKRSPFGNLVTWTLSPWQGCKTCKSFVPAADFFPTTCACNFPIRPAMVERLWPAASKNGQLMVIHGKSYLVTHAAPPRSAWPLLLPMLILPFLLLPAVAAAAADVEVGVTAPVLPPPLT